MSKEKNIKVEGETPEASHNEAEDVRVAEGAQDGAQAEQAEETETAEKANEPELTPEEKAKAEAVSGRTSISASSPSLTTTRSAP